MDTSSIMELDLKDIPRNFPSYPRITSNTATFLYHGNMYSHDSIAIFRKILKENWINFYLFLIILFKEPRG